MPLVVESTRPIEHLWAQIPMGLLGLFIKLTGRPWDQLHTHLMAESTRRIAPLWVQLPMVPADESSRDLIRLRGQPFMVLIIK